MASFIRLLLLVSLLIQLSHQASENGICRRTHDTQPYCMGLYGEPCGDNYCAMNVTSCEKFKNIKEISLFKVFLMPILFHFELNKYKDKMRSISTCPKEQYTWSSRDVCRMNKPCYLVEILSMGTDIVKYATKTECRCEQPNGSKCHGSKDLCGI